MKWAMKTFTIKDALTIYGMADAVIEETADDKIISIYKLGVYKLFIFTKKGEIPISSYTQLKGRSVGGIIGYEAYYQEIVRHNIHIDYFADEENQIKNFEEGRIDGIIGIMPDWIPYLNKLSYDPNFPIHAGYDNIG